MERSPREDVRLIYCLPSSLEVTPLMILTGLTWLTRLTGRML